MSPLGAAPWVEGQVLWSVKDRLATGGGSVGLDGEWEPSTYLHVEVRWQEWTVEKVTPRGAWVQPGLRSHNLRGFREWVSFSTRRVSATKAEAKEQAVRKRAYHLQMSKRRLEGVLRRYYALLRLEVPDA